MKLVVKTYEITDFSERNIITNVYLRYEFLSLLVKYFDFNVKYLVVKNIQTQNIVAVTISIEKKILGIPSLINPKAIYYQPIETFSAVRKNPNENRLQELEVFKEISEYYHKYYFKIEKNLPPEIEDVRGFVWAGINAIPLFTYRFNLENYSPENYFNRQRASLRKALNSDYSFSTDSNINSFFGLIEDTKQRQDWDFKFNKETLSNYLKELLELGLIEQFSIFNNKNEIISTMFCIMDKPNRIFYGWLTSTATNELSNGVSTLLIHSICEHLKKDYEIFDLCGANTETIARFKASLGAELKVFYRIKL